MSIRRAAALCIAALAIAAGALPIWDRHRGDRNIWSRLTDTAPAEDFAQQPPYRLVFHGPRSAREELIAKEALLDAQVHWLEFTGSSLRPRSTVQLHVITDVKTIPKPSPAGSSNGSWSKIPLCQGANDFVPLNLLSFPEPVEKQSLADRFFSRFLDPEDRPARTQPSWARYVDYGGLQRFMEETLLEAGVMSLRDTAPSWLKTAFLEALRADVSQQLTREKLKEAYIRQKTSAAIDRGQLQFPLCPARSACDYLTDWLIPALRFVRDRYGTHIAMQVLSKVTSGRDLPTNTPAGNARQFDSEFGDYLAKRYELDKDLPKSMKVKASALAE